MRSREEMEWLVDQMSLMKPGLRAKGNGLAVIVDHGNVLCFHTIAKVRLGQPRRSRDGRPL